MSWQATPSEIGLIWQNYFIRKNHMQIFPYKITKSSSVIKIAVINKIIWFNLSLQAKMIYKSPPPHSYVKNWFIHAQLASINTWEYYLRFSEILEFPHKVRDTHQWWCVNFVKLSSSPILGRLQLTKKNLHISGSFVRYWHMY